MLLSQTRKDDGFSVVELIIAMFLLAILALAVLPLLIGATKTSTVNRSLVAATTYANSQLAPIRVQFPNDGTNSCAAVSARASTGVTDTASGLLADIGVSACPTALPGTVTVTAKVYKTGSAASPLTTLSTKIVVTSP
ncbi:prepilin-type N-terminal cleavage/methylation domain-containing protein [Microbacterium sp.]|uniref:prepilin-type N-terminal cleavage/methylation domain-containing protein n=1 Tax=Microbacterium sp. TaxID=51671 RepID=UPI003F6EBB3A